MRRRFFSVAKELGRKNEDACLATFQRVAMSDGASTSYGGRAWARALVREYLLNPDVGKDWLASARERFRKDLAPDPNDWAAMLALDRGSFATFLGVIIDTQIGIFRGSAFGDTVLFYKTLENEWAVWPRMTASDFDKDPSLLCSIPGISPIKDEDPALAQKSEIRFQRGNPILVATDALARFIISRDLDESIDHVLSQRNAHQFENFVLSSRSHKIMQRDDTTLLVIHT